MITDSMIRKLEALEAKNAELDRQISFALNPKGQKRTTENVLDAMTSGNMSEVFHIDPNFAQRLGFFGGAWVHSFNKPWSKRLEDLYPMHVFDVISRTDNGLGGFDYVLQEHEGTYTISVPSSRFMFSDYALVGSVVFAAKEPVSGVWYVANPVFRR